MKRALFLDRDGVMNDLVVRADGKPHSPSNWEELVLNPERFDLAAVRSLGFELILVTNQPDIERGILTQAFCDEVHGRLAEELRLDAVYVCPFASPEHPWKKPNPGMLLEAARVRGLNLAQSFFLGDTQNDLGAASKAGVEPILYDRPYNQGLVSRLRVKRLGDVAAILEGAIARM